MTHLSAFLSLTYNVQDQVISHLGLYSLLCVRQTCRALKDIADGYINELKTTPQLAASHSFLTTSSFRGARTLVIKVNDTHGSLAATPFTRESEFLRRELDLLGQLVKRVPHLQEIICRLPVRQLSSMLLLLHCQAVAERLHEATLLAAHEDANWSLDISHALQNLSNLRKLVLVGWSFPESQGSHLSTLTQLKELKIHEAYNVGNGLSGVSCLTGLTSLQLSRIIYRTPIPGEFTGLSQLSHLEQVSLQDCDWFPEEVMALSTLTSITQLHVNTQFDMTVMAAWRLALYLTALADLSLVNLTLTEEDFGELAGLELLTALEVASLVNNDVDPVDAAQQRPQTSSEVQLKALKSLRIVDCYHISYVAADVWSVPVLRMVPNLAVLHLGLEASMHITNELHAHAAANWVHRLLFSAADVQGTAPPVEQAAVVLEQVSIAEELLQPPLLRPLLGHVRELHVCTTAPHSNTKPLAQVLSNLPAMHNLQHLEWQSRGSGTSPGLLSQVNNLSFKAPNLTTLTFRNFAPNPSRGPGCFAAFARLRRLEVQNMSISGADVMQLVSSCKALRELHVKACPDVSSASSKLAELLSAVPLPPGFKLAVHASGQVFE